MEEEEERLKRRNSREGWRGRKIRQCSRVEVVMEVSFRLSRGRAREMEWEGEIVVCFRILSLLSFFTLYLSISIMLYHTDLLSSSSVSLLASDGLASNGTRVESNPGSLELGSIFSMVSQLSNSSLFEISLNVSAPDDFLLDLSALLQTQVPPTFLDFTLLDSLPVASACLGRKDRRCEDRRERRNRGVQRFWRIPLPISLLFLPLV